MLPLVDMRVCFRTVRIRAIVNLECETGSRLTIIQPTINRGFLGWTQLFFWGGRSLNDTAELGLILMAVSF